RGKYNFCNVPLVNYLPDFLRRRLCPHVLAYTRGAMRRLLEGLDVEVIIHIQIYPGYDKIAARRPMIGTFLRRVTYALESTPLRAFGLSHFVVVEKQTEPSR
ncbi:MAG: class I SAM-dependent methyltransferase, partial [Anaerolineae bacterium]